MLVGPKEQVINNGQVGSMGLLCRNAMIIFVKKARLNVESIYILITLFVKNGKH
jgi:hypothetical protein